MNQGVVDENQHQKGIPVYNIDYFCNAGCNA
jgi:hypothetical protein